MENTRHDVVDGPLTLREGVKGLRAGDVPVSKEIWELLRTIGDKLVSLVVPAIIDGKEAEIGPNEDYRAYAVDSADEIPTVKKSADYARRMEEVQNLMFDAIIAELNKHPELHGLTPGHLETYFLACEFFLDGSSFSEVGLKQLTENEEYSFSYENTPASSGRSESDNPNMTTRGNWIRQIFNGIAKRLETAVITRLRVEGRMNYSAKGTFTRSVDKSDGIDWGPSMNRQFDVIFLGMPEKRIKVFFRIQPLPFVKPGAKYSMRGLSLTKAEWK